MIWAMSNTYHIAYTVMYHHRPPCMLIIVDHFACINISDTSICQQALAYIVMHIYICWSSCMYRYRFHLNIWKHTCTVIDQDTCLWLLIIVHVSLSMTPPYVSMYRRTQWYVLKIVYHRACIDNPAILPYVGMYCCRLRRMLMIVDHLKCIGISATSICKHLPSYTTIHAYDCGPSLMCRYPWCLHM